MSRDAQNVVIGLVRNKAEAEKALGEKVSKNLSFLEADITDLDALKVRIEMPSEVVTIFWAVEMEADHLQVSSDRDGEVDRSWSRLLDQ